MKRNLGINAFLNMIKTSLSILFPLITYPYISRTLGVSNLGKINYTSSLIGYFSLIATLGISTYAIREGGKVRENKEKLQKLGNQLFTLNILTTLLSFVFVLVTIFFFISSKEYRILLAIQSLTIFFTTIGVDWINVIFEDYLYITIRSVIIQLISLCFIFIFVKSPEDIYTYSIMTVLASGITCVMNLVYCRKYLKLKLTSNLEINKHMGLAINVYVNSDVLILQWMKGPYYVGLYTIAVRIYSIIKNMLASLYSVAIPKLSNYFEEKNFILFKRTYTKMLSIIILILLPMSSLLWVLSENIIEFMGGDSFSDSAITLKILSVSLIGAIFGGILTYALNIPIGKEKINLKGSIYGIFVNITFSIILIPFLNQNGAAIATVLSEFFIVIYNLLILKEYDKYIEFKKIIISSLHGLSGCLTIICVGHIIHFFFNFTIFLDALIISIISLLIYLIELVLYKDEIVFSLIKDYRNTNG
jgi:O-antigen/teichoic acid export membrane protein